MKLISILDFFMNGQNVLIAVNGEIDIRTTVGEIPYSFTQKEIIDISADQKEPGYIVFNLKG